MATAQEIRAASLVTGRDLKRKNAITALLCGAIPGLLASAVLHISPRGWLLGITIGLLWANAFEYFYHRYLLHWPQTSFGKGHLLHHLTTGTPREPEHATFGSSPVWVAVLFAANGIPALLVDYRFGLGVAPGILTGFSLYMILVEEIHWQVHLGGWIPGLRRIREYHMAHHDIPNGRYNVFFPFFDYVFGRIQPAFESTHAVAMSSAVTPLDAGDGVFGGALMRAALYVWVLGMSIGARYFWK
jgi:uncharacterized membrane protein YeaQ/YmgE (transglycosylase-associated protein family)